MKKIIDNPASVRAGSTNGKFYSAKEVAINAENWWMVDNRSSRKLLKDIKKTPIGGTVDTGPTRWQRTSQGWIVRIGRDSWVPVWANKLPKGYSQVGGHHWFKGIIYTDS